jgi:hypothetical protein
MSNCTCLAHGINRIAETIRLQFPLVNDLIKNGKKIFVKAPLRVQLFRERLPNIPLPPEPVLTRWGTWLDAAVYYANNFDAFKLVVLEFPDSASKSIKDCKIVLKLAELKQNLAFIKTNYGFISQVITSLEKQQVPLTKSVATIEHFKHSICAVPGPIGQIVKNKLESVLIKNEGFKKLNEISAVLSGEIVDEFELDVAIAANFKYAPITSVDVERSFSVFKNILTDRRHNFKMDNLEHHLVINCFQQE